VYADYYCTHSWHDADTIILNPTISLDTYLPGPEFKDDVFLLATNDQNGLNNGVFFVRVNTWAVELFSGIVGVNRVNTDLQLDHEDQGAMQHIITNVPYFESKTVIVSCPSGSLSYSCATPLISLSRPL
jgi:hypothetical protein